MNTDSRRPSLLSIQSTSSSIQSYGTKRFDRERERKEERETQKKLSQMNENFAKDVNNTQPASRRQNNSREELLSPVLEKVQSVNKTNYFLFLFLF